MLMRAYMRDRAALFFGFFFPLIFMILFGVLNFGAPTRVALGVVDDANNDDSQRFVATLSAIDTFRVTKGSRAGETDRLTAGERDLVLVIPADFRIAPARAGAAVPTITLYSSSGRPEQGAIGTSIITQVVDQISFAVTQTSPIVSTKREELAGHGLRYVDFLTPGIIGMTIMQS